MINLQPALHMGIDPGLYGAISVVDHNNNVTIIDMPLAEQMVGGKIKRRIVPERLAEGIAKLIGDCAVKAYIEKVGAMPGQGVVSSFNFGTNFGLVRGVLAALEIECHEVSPVTWKKGMRLNSSKAGSIHLACSLFPRQSSSFELRKHEGRAEAALIAMWGKKYG